MCHKKLPTIKYPKGVVLEELSAVELVDWLASEAVRLSKLLPVKFQRHEEDGEEYLIKRSVWLEFCAIVKKDTFLGNEIYPYYIVQRVVENVLNSLAVPDLTRIILVSSETWQGLSLDEANDLLWTDESEIVTAEVMRKVISIGKKSPVKNPYQMIKTLGFALNDSDFDMVFDPKETWELFGLDKAGTIEIPDMSPQAKCRRDCEKILNVKKEKKDQLGIRNSGKEGIFEELPCVIEAAISCAESPSDFNEITDFASELLVAIQTIYDRYKPNWQMIYWADPALFFDFARKPVLTQTESVPFVDKVMRILNDLCPNREKPIAELLLTVVRRLTGDQDAVYPMLYGDPGTGKTFLVEQLSDAFTEAGLKTHYIHQPMTGSLRSDSNDVSMSLEGTTSKWGNGRHGIIYNNIFLPTMKLGLVALDELDKCGIHDYLVSLLDPRQQLQDAFWRDFFAKIDMRSKVMFFGTANNIELIRKGGTAPLWSRLAPIETPPYTVNEAIELVTNLVCKRQQFEIFTDNRAVESITDSVVHQYDGRSLPSVRAILDQVKRELHLRQYPSLERILSKRREQYHYPTGIGFAVK